MSTGSRRDAVARIDAGIDRRQIVKHRWNADAAQITFGVWRISGREWGIRKLEWEKGFEPSTLCLVSSLVEVITQRPVAAEWQENR